MWADEEEGSPQADEEEGPPQADEEEGSPQADEDEGSPQAMDSPAASIEVDLRVDSSSPAPASTGCCPASRAGGSSPAQRADGSNPKPAASPGFSVKAAADRAVPRSPDDAHILQGRPFIVKLESCVNRLAGISTSNHCQLNGPSITTKWHALQFSVGCSCLQSGVRANNCIMGCK